MPDIKEHIKQLGADEQAAYKANKALLELVTRASAPDADAQRQELAKALADELNRRNDDPKKKDYIYPAPVRVKMVRLLSFVLGEAQIPALAEALRDLDTREMARFSLDFAPSAASTTALIAALDDVGPEFRVGVVGALRRRGGPEALKKLQEVATSDSDPEVQIAAGLALASFPEVANDAIIAKIPCRKSALKARVQLAETLRKNGKAGEAAKIYKAIESGASDPHHKRAAQLALKASA